MSDGQIAIETSCRQGSVALLDRDLLVEQIILPRGQRTAQSISVALDQLLQRARAERLQLEHISVGVGPGSFTGLRIGLTAAKTLAYALGLQVAACDTLAAAIVAIRCDFPEKQLIDFSLNAYRGQVFWRREDHQGKIIIPTQVVDFADWSRHLSESNLIAAGDVWQQRGTATADLITAGIELAPEPYWIPKAEHIGTLGWQAKQVNTLISPFQVLPNYLRQSAAEEKLNARR